MESTNKEEPVVLTTFLKKHIARARNVLEKGDVNRGQLKLLTGSIRWAVAKVYGDEHEITRSLSPRLISENLDVRKEFERRIHLLDQFIISIEKVGINTFINKNTGSRVFIGHGKSPIWRELKDFLHERLELPWDEFNREAVAGITTFKRISDMLDSASFAFLIMTAEDEHADATTHARQNVVHELGLFQGRLGPKKAIILIEDVCSEFSNIVGLSQIRFPKGHISAVFEEIRRVLEREGVIKA